MGERSVITVFFVQRRRPSLLTANMATSDLCFFLNGDKVVLTDVQPEITLLEFLRSRLLTGTKLGCGEVR